jgi:hypothetical protein
MREYTFVKKGPIKIGDDTVVTEIEAMSLKKAMKSFQGGDAKEVEIKWTSRKGNPSSKVVKLPYKPRSERKGRL